jgi:transposase-like protein
MPAAHPVEFRRRAVELARTGDKPVAALVKDLGISESCLRNWIARTDDDGGRVDRLTSAENEGRDSSGTAPWRALPAGPVRERPTRRPPPHDEMTYANRLVQDSQVTALE